MAFAMLRNLGESKFKAIQDELARGKAPLALARTTKRQWGEFQDCPETLLALQLPKIQRQQERG
jgi:hypothetical protein